MIPLNSFIDICSFRRAANNFVCKMLFLIECQKGGDHIHSNPATFVITVDHNISISNPMSNIQIQ